MLETIKKKKPGRSKQTGELSKNDTPGTYTREELEKKNMEYILKKERTEKVKKDKQKKYFNVFTNSLAAAWLSIVGGTSTVCSVMASNSLRTIAAVIAIGGFAYLISKLFGS